MMSSLSVFTISDSFVALALDSGVTLAEAAVLARHANAKVTGAI